MAKKSTKKDNYAVEVGARLRNIIEAYFSNQKDFATKVNIIESAISKYANGTLLISDKIANTFQVNAGINKDYLFNGNLPMMLNDAKPIKEHLVASKTPTKQLIEQATVSNINSGWVKQFTLSKSGYRTALSNSGDMNLVDFVLDGIDEPISVLLTDVEFCQKYQIQFGSALIVGGDIRDGVIVLVDLDGKFILAVSSGETVKDTRDEQAVYLKSEVTIIGKAYSKMERI